jgi:glyoxylase-like metal-dependent hydrolase (beta-lactamase superfamily II)
MPKVNDSVTITLFANMTYDSRTYVIAQNGYNASIVIDPGSPDAKAVMDFLGKHDTEIDFIILTHEHFDHIAGVNALKQRYHCKLICSQECSERIGDPKKNLSRYLTGLDYICGPADYTCEEIYHQLQWGGVTIRLINTPGHSSGSICVAIQNHLFTGDTLVFNTKTVVKLPGGNKHDLNESIHYIFTHFDKKTFIYPGHGESFRLEEVEKGEILTLSA